MKFYIYDVFLSLRHPLAFPALSLPPTSALLLLRVCVHWLDCWRAA